LGNVREEKGGGGDNKEMVLPRQRKHCTERRKKNSPSLMTEGVSPGRGSSTAPSERKSYVGEGGAGILGLRSY